MFSSDKDSLYIQQQLMHIIYKNLLSAMVAASIVASLMVFMLWQSVSHMAITLWIFAVLLTHLFRYLNARKRVAELNGDIIVQAKWEFYFGLLISCLLWGVIIIAFFPVEQKLQLFVIVMYAGLSAGAVNSLAPFRRFFITFFILFLVPLIVKLFILEGNINKLLALSVTIYMVAMIFIAMQIHQMLRDTILTKMRFKASEKDLEHSKRHIEKIFEQTPIGIFSFDCNLYITKCNQGMADILSLPIEKIKGINLHELHNQLLFQTQTEKILNGENVFYQGNYRSHLSDKNLWVEVKASPIRSVDQSIEGGLVTFMDISEKKIKEEKIEFLAYHDELTALPNRINLCEHLERALISRSKTPQYSFLMFIDLDYFKTINDSLGHHIGDKLLKQFVRRVLNLLSGEQILSRLGGDEFILFGGKNYVDPMVCINEALGLSDTIHAALAKDFIIDKHNLHLTASIGVTLIDYQKDDKHEALKHADLAMYKAKEEGRNRTCLYQEDMDRKIRQRLMAENELHAALREERLELHFQPIVSSKTKKIVCVEALLRYKKANEQLVYPERFIHIAEESGMIIPIGYWIIEEACKAYYFFQKGNEGFTLKNIAINISAKQFMQNDFIAQMRAIIDSYRLSYTIFELELTESVFIADMKGAIEKMHELKKLGFLLSMDDFGTGFSSLSYLQQMPFDLIKIDKSFVDNIFHNRQDKNMIFTIFDICKIYGKKVIAEGLETEDQVMILDHSSCDFYQGYIFAKPMNKEHLKHFYRGLDRGLTD